MIDSFPAFGDHAPTDEVGRRFVYEERLVSAKRKVDRWHSAAATVALWGLDVEEVSAAAARVREAMNAFDNASDAVVWTASLVDSLANVELEVAAYERALTENVRVAGAAAALTADTSSPR